MPGPISQKVINIIITPGSRFAASLARQMKELAALHGGEVRMVFAHPDGTTDTYTVYPGLTLADHAFITSTYPGGRH